MPSAASNCPYVPEISLFIGNLRNNFSKKNTEIFINQYTKFLYFYCIFKKQCFEKVPEYFQHVFFGAVLGALSALAEEGLQA